MGISKILFMALLLWIAYKVYSSYKLGTKKADNNRMNEKIIPCNFCQTHIPIESAIKVNNKYFCSIDHSKNV